MLNHPVEFKIDTGAAVSAITEETYFELKQPKLYQAKKKLCGPAQQKLEVLGVFQVEKLCEDADEDIQEQYAKVFTGLGNFGNEYDIKLKGNV